MNLKIVKLKNIEIKNFKNIEYGRINIENHNDEYDGNVLGIYGQNGTGKTSIINAIQLLKLSLIGAAIPNYYADYINIECNNSYFKYELSIDYDDEIYNISYEFKLGKKEYTVVNLEGANNTIKPFIYDEVLSFSYNNKDINIRKNQVINTETDENTVFLPSLKYNLLIDKSIKKNDLILLKKMSVEKSISFIFSKEFIDILDKHYENKFINEEFQRIYFLLKTLINYGDNELFIINTFNSGLISLNSLPITYRRIHDKNNVVYGKYYLQLNKIDSIPSVLYNETKKIIDSINIVLGKIIPNLQIQIDEYGSEIGKDGSEQIKVYLFSVKNGKKIPLVYESEGIKKIISILQLIIVMYNQPNITVAIDELDSGIFEFLLGELLSIISERGMGQLIFTSHNLRPLEMIDKKCISFTTSNPKNRIIKLSGVKENNNLRDFYFRGILLGGQCEKLYDSFNIEEIGLAFRMAGDRINE